MNTSSHLIIATLAAPHGVRGWIRLISHTQSLEQVLHYRPWYYQDVGQWRLFEIEGHRVTDKNLLVKPTHCDDRNAASLLTHLKLFIPREQLPPLNPESFYWHDLIGLAVQDQQQQLIGHVERIQAMPAQDLLIVKTTSGQPVMIPCLLNQHITAVNLTQGRITVDREMIDW